MLRDVLQSRDISTNDILHHLCELAKILDSLKLYDECRLTGNCALDLAERLGQRALEFRHEQAEALALIAGLSVYKPRARTLFSQAVYVYEEVVENNASDSNKHSLFTVLCRAGSLTSGHLSTQWLERAIQLMTELPPIMVHPHDRSVIYYHYGNSLRHLERNSNALKAYDEAISIIRTQVGKNPATSNLRLAQALTDMGMVLRNLGEYDDATVAYKEALEICTTMSTQDPLRYNEQVAITLLNYGVTLEESNQVSEAAVVKKQAVSLFRDLAQTGNERTSLLCAALNNYARSCYLLGQHAEAVLVYQEFILMQRGLVAANSEEEKHLIVALHNIANSFNTLDKRADANDAADEALERNHGRVVASCSHAPDFKACFVCRRGTIPGSLRNISLSLLVCFAILGFFLSYASWR